MFWDKNNSENIQISLNPFEDGCHTVHRMSHPGHGQTMYKYNFCCKQLVFRLKLIFHIHVPRHYCFQCQLLNAISVHRDVISCRQGTALVNCLLRRQSHTLSSAAIHNFTYFKFILFLKCINN